MCCTRASRRRVNERRPHKRFPRLERLLEEFFFGNGRLFFCFFFFFGFFTHSFPSTVHLWFLIRLSFSARSVVVLIPFRVSPYKHQYYKFLTRYNSIFLYGRGRLFVACRQVSRIVIQWGPQVKFICCSKIYIMHKLNTIMHFSFK